MPHDPSVATRIYLSALILALITMALVAHAAEDPLEVEVVVASTREVHPDGAKLCQSGQAGILNAASTQAKELAMEGKISGNVQALATEAAVKIGKDCFG
jgi:coenzyme F420-reducing hydrogenase beta subunit